MAQVWVFFAGIAITAAVAAFVASYLRPHLATLLAELCGSERRGAFWIAFTNVTLVLLPVIAAMAYRPGSVIEPAQVIFALSEQVLLGLGALAGAVVIIGTVISSNLPKNQLLRPAVLPQQGR